jgi:imidazolonepropionase-like amidohydrolase
MKTRQPFFALVFAVVWFAPGQAQQVIDAPRDYALTNARVVVSPGRVLERATVLLRGGRIAAVGDRVAVPAGVITVDVTGMTVYPGLIDAASSLGLPRVQPAGGGFRGAGGDEPESAPEGPPPELNPARNAVDAWTPTDPDLAALRAAGITMVGLAFDGGIFPGRVSAVSVRDGSPTSLVVKSPVAQQVGLGRRRGGGYPTTLMGTLAYIEQSFKDARWDARATAAFEKSPATAPRPVYDAEHRALQPAAAGSMPIWIQASTANDLKRVIKLARDLTITDYVVVGALEGYQVTNELKATGRPAIVSLNFPSPNQLTGRAYELHVAPASGPDREAEQLDSTATRAARANAAALAGAGIPVALSSLGVSGPAEFRSRILAAVEAGLSADDALRALTVTPAQLLGLSNVVGTIEPGRLANVVVVQGDLFSRDGKVKHVFVEGEKYDVTEAPPPPRGQGAGQRRGGGPGGAAENAAAPLATGEWNGTVDAQGNQMAITINISGEPDALSGSITSEMGTTPLSGSQSGADVTLRGVITTPNGEASIVVSTRINGNAMQGTISVGDMGSFAVTAQRRPGAASDPGIYGGVR